MVKVFRQGDDEQYRQWLADNNELGYVINRGPDDHWMLPTEQTVLI